MEGVSLITPLTVDIIFAGLAAVPKKGEEVYSKSFTMTAGGGATVAAKRLNDWNIPVKAGTFLSNGSLSRTAEEMCRSLGFPPLYNLYKGQEECVIISCVMSYKEDRSIVSFDRNINENILSDKEIYDFMCGAEISVALNRPDAMKKLKADGTVLIYDVHSEEQLSMKNHEKILDCADIFTPNDREAMILTGENTAEKALIRLSDYTAFPVVKTGKNGAIAVIDGKIKYFYPPEVNTVDTTGAGDNFTAGYIYGIYKGEGPEKCIEYANRAGAYSTEAPGCFGALYNLE